MAVSISHELEGMKISNPTLDGIESTNSQVNINVKYEKRDPIFM